MWGGMGEVEGQFDFRIERVDTGGVAVCHEARFTWRITITIAPRSLTATGSFCSNSEAGELGIANLLNLRMSLLIDNMYIYVIDRERRDIPVFDKGGEFVLK